MSCDQEVEKDGGESNSQEAAETNEISRPRRAVKPVGYYRKHAASIDNLIDRERQAAAKAERRKAAESVPENALEFLQYSSYSRPILLGPEEEEDIDIMTPTPSIGSNPTSNVRSVENMAVENLGLGLGSPETRPRLAKRKAAASSSTDEAPHAPKRAKLNESKAIKPVKRKGRPRIHPIPAEKIANFAEDRPEGEIGGILDVLEEDEYASTLDSVDPDDLLEDLNRPVDVPIRDCDVMNGTLAKTMEKEGLIPEGHDENWEKLKWTQGTFVNCDLRYYNLTALGKFDVILIDPPWRLRGAQNMSDERTMFNNSRFALSYDTLAKEEIMDLEVGCLSDRGFIFLWTINSQLQAAFECLNKWGYTYIDKITWIKKTNNANVHISQGFYLLHSSEVCLIGVKRNTSKSYLEFIPKVSNDLIFAETRKKSQKPEQLYVLIERMFPGAKKIELFGRNHNIRPGWLTLGNQLGELYNWANDIVQCNHCKHLIHIGIGRYKHRHIPDSDICARCWKAAQATPALASKFREEDYFRLLNHNDEMAFHEYYECNGCKARPLWGIRFTCEQCSDFDLCEECHDARYVPDELRHVHSSEHKFIAVEIPQLAGGLPIHRIRCAGCDLSPIVGYRFKCMECPASSPTSTLLSLCQKCFFAKKEPKTHKATHQMELVIEPQLAHSSKCDICGVKPIIGTRYKCNSCYNFDICEACYVSKRPAPRSKVSHKPNHTYMKITGDVDPENYRGPVETPSLPPKPSETGSKTLEVSVTNPVTRALVVGNQKKRAQLRQQPLDEDEDGDIDIDGENSIDNVDIDDEDDDEEDLADAEILESALTDASARFILFNQRMRYHRG